MYKSNTKPHFTFALCVLCIGIMMAFDHPFYLGVTEIQYHPVDKKMEINVRLFTDDLETSLQKTAKLKVNLTAPSNQQTMDSLVNVYVQQHLKLKADRIHLTLAYQGYELNEEACWIYFDAKCPEIPRQLELTNSLLYERISEQSHIIHLRFPSWKNSYKLDYPDSVHLWTIGQ